MQQPLQERRQQDLQQKQQPREQRLAKAHAAEGQPSQNDRETYTKHLSATLLQTRPAECPVDASAAAFLQLTLDLGLSREHSDHLLRFIRHFSRAPETAASSQLHEGENGADFDCCFGGEAARTVLISIVICA